MTQQRLAQFSQHQWRWHHANGLSQLSVSREARHWQALEDGSWLQKTMADPLRPLPPPHAWMAQIRFWKRRLRHLAITDFQWTCKRRTVFLFSPRPGWMPPFLEWSASWTFPSRGLGTLLGSMHFRQNQPPIQFLAGYLEQLGRIPLLGASALPGHPIFFDGRLLIHFLAPALKHLSRQNGVHGHWLRHPKHPAPETPSLEAMGTPLDDPPSPLPSPLLPQHLRFVPQTTRPHLTESWRAVLYDSDQQCLICRKFISGHWVYSKFALQKPLYQHFPELEFQNNARQLVIRNRLVTLADAIWLPKKPSNPNSGP